MQNAWLLYFSAGILSVAGVFLMNLLHLVHETRASRQVKEDTVSFPLLNPSIECPAVDNVRTGPKLGHGIYIGTKFTAVSLEILAICRLIENADIN